MGSQNQRHLPVARASSPCPQPSHTTTLVSPPSFAPSWLPPAPPPRPQMHPNAPKCTSPIVTPPHPTPLQNTTRHYNSRFHAKPQPKACPTLTPEQRRRHPQARTHPTPPSRFTSSRFSSPFHSTSSI